MLDFFFFELFRAKTFTSAIFIDLLHILMIMIYFITRTRVLDFIVWISTFFAWCAFSAFQIQEKMHPT